jgi:hypothetical protein
MSRGLRWFLCGLGALGTCGFIIGLIGDLRGWWTNLGYTSNVLAGVTGACFGIPFAVLVLQRLLNENQLRANRRNLQNRMVANLTNIEIIVAESLAEVRPLSTTSMRDTWNHLKDLRKASRSEELSDVPQPPPASRPATEKFQEELRKTLMSFSAVHEAKSPDHKTVSERNDRRAARWQYAQTRWQLVSEELVPDAEAIHIGFDEMHINAIDKCLQKEPPTTDLLLLAYKLGIILVRPPGFSPDVASLPVLKMVSNAEKAVLLGLDALDAIEQLLKMPELAADK